MSVCKSGGGQMMPPNWDEGYRQGYRDAIKEAARVADNSYHAGSHPFDQGAIAQAKKIAAAIRALKEQR